MKDYLTYKGFWNETETNYILSHGSCRGRNTQKKQSEALFLENIIAEDRSNRLRLRRLSDKIFDPETLDRSKDKGNKVHTAFALIRSGQDVPEAIRSLQVQGVISASEANDIKEAIEKVMELPELKPLFAEGLEVRNEREILKPNADFLRPDRVVIKDKIAYIIDYKTGLPRESHQKQLNEYAVLYRKMGYKEVKALLVYLEEMKVVEI